MRERATPHRVHGAHRLVQQQVLHVRSLRGEQKPSPFAASLVHHAGALGLGAPAAARATYAPTRARRSRPRAALLEFVGELREFAETCRHFTHALDRELVFGAVEEGAQRRADARMRVCEQPASNVREALLDDAVLSVRLQAEALDGREGAQNEHEVWRDAHGILLGDLLQLIA